jgi:hypothetical protein
MPRKDYNIKNNVRLSAAQQKRFKSNFGIDASTVISAMKGEEQANKQLGSLAVEGRIIADNKEVIVNSLAAVIDGTVALAEVNQKMITEGNRAATTIRQLQNNTLTAEQQFNSKQTEMSLALRDSYDYEKSRHQATIDYQRQRRLIQDAQLITDTNYRAEQMYNGMALKQKDAGLTYQKEVNKHYLAYGNEANKSLVAAKDYGVGDVRNNPISVVIEGIKQWLTGGR